MANQRIVETPHNASLILRICQQGFRATKLAKGNSGIGDVEILTNKRDGFGASLDHKDGNYDGADVKIRVLAKVGLGDVKVVR